MRNRADIEAVWARLHAVEGEVFKTVSGLEFTYAMKRDALVVDRARQNLPKSQFAKALALVPLEGPGAISKRVRGPFCIWAILHDARVRGSAW